MTVLRILFLKFTFTIRRITMNRLMEVKHLFLENSVLIVYLCLFYGIKNLIKGRVDQFGL